MDTENKINKKEDVIADVLGAVLDVTLGSVDVIGPAIETVITAASHIG